MESFGQPFCSSTASSPSKLNTAASSENATATAPAPAKMTTSLGRKRPPLGDITNDRRNRSKTSLPSSSLEENSTKSSKLKSNAVASVVSSKSGGVSVSIDESVEVTEDVCTSRDAVGVVDIDTDDEIVNLDANSEDPQLCVTIACDIYKHLRESETRKRPATDFMERIQTDINANMRAILIDWLVEVVEEYRLVPDTLYLTVNYIDRYLSGNMIKRQRLQLLGVACLMIAAKYEEICAPRAEVFCYITDNTYNKDELLEMESAVLNYLKFEMTAPTIRCFLRRFVRAANGSMQLECLANYIAELSLLDYRMLCYPPSILAASSIFLAKFIRFPSRRPWNSTLSHYTLYQACDLLNCVKDLHRLCCSFNSPTIPAIREKYNTHKYNFVAEKSCPPEIPDRYFNKQSS